MAGHSKWAKVKHQKKLTDAVKSKIFAKLTKAITLAVKQGGRVTDLVSNFHLRLAVDRAKSFNMPKENIQRAIDRAAKGKSAQNMEDIIYEAFGPAGVGIIMETATDNKQRTVAQIKQILDRGGGHLATTGAVSHLFELVGQILVLKDGKGTDELMEMALEVGAYDFEDMDDTVAIYTEPKSLHKIKEKLSSLDLKVSSTELIYRPKTTVSLRDSDKINKLLKLVVSLEEIEDIQRVHTNFDIPEEYLQKEYLQKL